jgi:cell wall-associated NlpC family hydrolase
MTKTRRSTLKTSRKSTVKNSYSNRVKIADYAKNFLKTPYRYAGKTPDGFDCSGFTSFVFRNYGIEIGSSSREQAKSGKSKKLGMAERGDLVFFGNNNKVSHVGMVYAIEDNDVMMIHASSSRGVMITNLSESEYWQKKLLFARDVMSTTRNELAFR